MDDLIITPQPRWVRVTLNRPGVRNALNTALLGQLADALDRLAENDECRVVLIHGAEGHFAAGADIAEVENKTTAEAQADPRKELWARVRSFPKPIIAAVDGYCLGGGFELALMADGIVAGETARFGLPETSLGIMPGAGGSQRLTALVGRARATRMILLGEIIDSKCAEDWGIAAWRTEGSALPEAERISGKLAVRAPLSMRSAKQAIVAGDENSLAFEFERTLFEHLFDSEDKREGIAAFRGKRNPEYKGR